MIANNVKIEERSGVRRGKLKHKVEKTEVKEPMTKRERKRETMRREK